MEVDENGSWAFGAQEIAVGAFEGGACDDVAWSVAELLANLD